MLSSKKGQCIRFGQLEVLTRPNPHGMKAQIAVWESEAVSGHQTFPPGPECRLVFALNSAVTLQSWQNVAFQPP